MGKITLWVKINVLFFLIGFTPQLYSFNTANNNFIENYDDGICYVFAEAPKLNQFGANYQNRNNFGNKTAALSISITKTEATCSNNSDGSLSANASSGQSPYSYSWTGPGSFSANGAMINKLKPGSYTVTVTDANNATQSKTTTLGFTDSQNPTVLTKNITVQLDANGQTSISPDDVDNGSSDNCGIDNRSLNISNFDCGNVGTNTVTLTVTDVNGNSASKSATVTVEDKVNPIVKTKPITVQLDANGQASISPEDLDDGSLDNCGINNRSLNISNFDCSNIGTNTVLLTVTDVNGNSASKSATVTVKDNINPTVKTKSITVQLDASGKASISPKDVDNGSFDNCEIKNISLDITNFDCSKVGTNNVILSVTDVNGNSASKTAIVTVNDVVQPTVLTKNITVQLDATGKVSISPEDLDNGSSDNCGIENISLNKTNFDCSNIGSNSVTLTITDVHGNSATNTAIVTVEDKIAPVVPNIDDEITWSCGKDIPVPVATDNCTGQISGTTDNLSFDSPGNYPITWTFQDGNGNTSSVQQTIILPNPKLKPEIIEELEKGKIYCNGNSTPEIKLEGTPTGTIFNISGGSGIGLADKFDVTEIPTFTPINNSYEPIKAIIKVTPYANGCKGPTVEYQVTVNPTPNISISPSSQEICSGGTTSFNLSGSVSGSTFDWTVEKPAGIEITDDISKAATIEQTLKNNTTETKTVTYKITPEASACSGTPISVTVTVNPTPKLDFKSKELCSPANLTTLELAEGSTKGLSFTYFQNGNQVQNPTNVPAGNYTVIGTSGSGCTAQTDITLNATPELRSSTVMPEICSGSFEYIFDSDLPNTTFYWRRPEIEGISGFSNGEGNINESLVNNTNEIITVIYEVFLVAETGCTNGEEEPINITVPVYPTLKLEGKITDEICSGYAVAIDNRPNFEGASLSWRYVPHENIQIKKTTGAGSINAILTNTSGNTIPVEFIYTLKLGNCDSKEVSVFINVKPAPIVKTWVSMSDQGKSNAVPNEITICHPSSPADINSVKLYSDASIPFDTEQTELNLDLDDFSLWTPSTNNKRWEEKANGSNAFKEFSSSCSFFDRILGRCNDYDYYNFKSNDNSSFFLLDADGYSGNSTLTLKNKFNTENQKNVILSFYHYFDNRSGQGSVEYRADGVNWTPLYTFEDNVGSYNNFIKEEYSIPLNLKNVQIRFVYDGGRRNSVYWAINSIKISGEGTAPAEIIWIRSDDPSWSKDKADLEPNDIGTINETTTFTATYTYEGIANGDNCNTGQNSVTVKVLDPVKPQIKADYCAYPNEPNKIKLYVSDSYDSYEWTASGEVISTDNHVDVQSAQGYTIKVWKNGCEGTASIDISKNLVINGDFDDPKYTLPYSESRNYGQRDIISNGDILFTTKYDFKRNPHDSPNQFGALGPEGTMAVGSDANDYHVNFTGRDHTTGTGNFLMINGDSNLSQVVWETNGYLDIKKNTDYYFSAWTSNLDRVNRGSRKNFAKLRLQVFVPNNNNPVTQSTLGDLYNPKTGQGVTPGEWIEFYNPQLWNSGNHTKVKLRIINEEPERAGNDFGIDDISFAELSAIEFDFAPSYVKICEGSDLQLYANLDGGREPITFSWTSPNGFTSSEENPVIENATAEMAGKYSLIVTDFYGCNIEPKTIIVEIPVLNTGEEEEITYCAAEIEEDGVRLKGSIDNLQDSNLELSAVWETEGGGTIVPASNPEPNTFPIIYFPSPEEIENGDTISFTLKYSNQENGSSCSKGLTLIINPSPVIEIESSTNISCFGGSDGTATAKVTSGTAPFTYEWKNAAGEVLQNQTTKTATGLKAGTYTVNVTDAVSCSATTSEPIEILAPTAFKIEDRGFEEPKCGENNNTAYIKLSGGNIPGVTDPEYLVLLYEHVGNEVDASQISKSTAETEAGTITTFTAINLPAGNYTFNVSTAAGCSATTVSLTIPYKYCVNLDFDGIDDYVDLGSSFSGNYSIGVWIRPETTNGTILSNKDKNGNGFDLSLSNGKPSFSWNGTQVNSNYPLKINNRWFHIAVSFNGAQAELFVDGISMGQGSGSGMASSNSPLLIGARYNSATKTTENHFSGWIEEVRLWEKQTTQEQIRFLMNQRLVDKADRLGAEIPMPVAGLTFSTLGAYYQLLVKEINKNAGTTPDLSSNKHPGILKNMETAQENTAPLPYISKKDGVWSDTNTWLHPDVWDWPNAKGINGDKIDWNIAEISHNITSGGHDITLLGLLSKDKQLTMANPNETANENNSGQGLTITHYLKLDGIVDLVGESQLVQTDIDDPDTHQTIISQLEGSGYIMRDQQGTASSYNYNYWSSPVLKSNSASTYTVKEVMFDGTNTLVAPKVINFGDTYFYADGSLTSPIKISNYWINTFHDVANQYVGWDRVGSDHPILPGEGYTMKGSADRPLSDMQNYTFKGFPNNGTITVDKIKPKENYLLGNPYPSAISVEEFILDNINQGEGRNDYNLMNGAVYFWDHFGGHTHYLEKYIGGYAVRNLLDGVPAISTDERINANGDIGTKSPGAYIPVGQGFFVNTSIDPARGIVQNFSEGKLIFKNSQRVFEKESTGSNSDSQFLKPEYVETKAPVKEKVPKIRLDFDSPLGYHRQILVGASKNTTDGFDLGYDAPLNDDNAEDMFWIIDSMKFVIQGVPDFNLERVLPLGIKTDKEGDITISINELKDIPEDTRIFVHDKSDSTYTDLRKQDFKIELEPGENLDRFEITFNDDSEPENPEPDEENPEEPDPGENPDDGSENPNPDGENGGVNPENPKLDANLDVLYLWKDKQLAILNPQQISIQKVIIFNLLGQKIQEFDRLSNEKREMLEVKEFPDAIYVVKIYSEKGTMSKNIMMMKR